MEYIKFFVNFMQSYSNILLVFTGLGAILVYWLQKRQKETEAASLIVLQIDELQDKLREISTYIVNKQSNSTAFYESLPLMEDNYWNQYKHYFIRKMDARSYSTLNLLYDYVSEVQEQQLLMKSLQKNHFFALQNSIVNVEMQFIYNNLSFSSNQIVPQNYDSNLLWNTYNQQRIGLENIINQNTITMYTPEQIRVSLEKILTEWRSLEVIGCDGYRMLSKISKRRFLK